MYGYRARIGYTSPPYLTETFPYEFYRMVPDGVTLVLTTLAIKRLTEEETERSVAMTLEAAREMGRAGVDIVVFGGVPLNLSLGYDGLAETMRRTEDEIGVPVTSSVTAQVNALRAVGAGGPRSRAGSTPPMSLVTGSRRRGCGAPAGRWPSSPPCRRPPALCRDCPGATRSTSRRRTGRSSADRAAGAARHRRHRHPGHRVGGAAALGRERPDRRLRPPAQGPVRADSNPCFRRERVSGATTS